VLVGGSGVEIKTEADSNDITECSHDDKPTTGMFSFFVCFVLYVCMLCVNRWKLCGMFGLSDAVFFL